MVRSDTVVSVKDNSDVETTKRKECMSVVRSDTVVSVKDNTDVETTKRKDSVRLW